MVWVVFDLASYSISILDPSCQGSQSKAHKGEIVKINQAITKHRRLCSAKIPLKSQQILSYLRYIILYQKASNQAVSLPDKLPVSVF
jgi:hypothetical protein